MTYEHLTKRIKQVEKALTKKKSAKSWWQGYLAALSDIRNDMTTEGEKC